MADIRPPHEPGQRAVSAWDDDAPRHALPGAQWRADDMPDAGPPRREPPPRGGFRTFGHGVAVTARFTGRATARGGRGTARMFLRATRAEGAGESGLANLIDLHSIHSAADAMLTVALANTLFFAVDASEARSRVALYLLVTMVPFAVIAPVVGPLLDRFRNGRRYAIATTQIVRAFLCWVMAGAIMSQGAFALYPAAFGALICSKAYGVTRSAVVPRVLPPAISLVRANARLTLWGTIAAAIGAPIAQGLTWATGSASWSLRLAALIYLVGAGFSFRLPARVDSNEGEERLRRRGPETDDDTDTRIITGTRVIKNVPPKPKGLFRRILPPLRGVGPRMPMMLRAISGLKAFSGFLTLFLAFLIRSKPLGVFSPNVDLGVVVAAAAVGSVTGTTIGAWLKSRRSEPLAVVALAMASVAGVVTAIWFGLLTAALVILVGNLASSIGKLGLDSVIQTDAADAVRTSAFARSETVLQLSWVLGGFLAIILPSIGSLGLALGSAVLIVILVLTVHSVRTMPERGIEQLRRRRAARGVGG